MGSYFAQNDMDFFSLPPDSHPYWWLDIFFIRSIIIISILWRTKYDSSCYRRHSGRCAFRIFIRKDISQIEKVKGRSMPSFFHLHKLKKHTEHCQQQTGNGENVHKAVCAVLIEKFKLGFKEFKQIFDLFDE